MPIRQLPETLINQIKAGEVVERPASALKEMMDNAIDSGATTIKASIEKGGLSLISVDDDGLGISVEDLPLAFARHATSKIETFEDLSTVTTMGFRGEALASLAAVSRCKIISKQAGLPAYEISAEEGIIGEVAPSSRQQGTTVSARDLFFYVPARRKFLKSEQTESNHCRDAFVRAAMSRPDIAMTFVKDGKMVYRLPIQTALERAKALIGPSFSGQVATVSATFGAFSITGFAAPMAALPSGKETQLLFVNKRYARDRLLSHAAKEALIQSRGLGRERDVAFVLFFDLPTELVDANAHPAKTEVRFRDPRGAHQFVSRALSDALATLPPPIDPPLPAGHRPLEHHQPREAEMDLFGDRSAQQAGGPTQPIVSNDSEKFLGVLRGGMCAWDAKNGLWLASPASLSRLSMAIAMAGHAENGDLIGSHLLIPSQAEGLADVQLMLASRGNQLQALGLDIDWLPGGSCSVSSAPDGFDNCDWAESLRALALAFASGRSDALSLCMALASGVESESVDDAALWASARSWMEMRRFAREIPGATFVSLPAG